MDHEEAMRMRAAERYVLGELSVSEVEDYERHFFDCSQCSEELRTLAILQDNARAVLLEPSPAPAPASLPQSEASPKVKASGWWATFGWAPAFAGVELALFAGYEFGARRAVEPPQAIAAFPLYSASRGDETVVKPAAGSRLFSLYLDKTWNTDYPSYRAVVRDESGAERDSLNVPPPAAGRAIYLLIPTHSLPAGKYVVTIMANEPGGKEIETGRYPFTLRFE
jgi:hypothetical protein